MPVNQLCKTLFLCAWAISLGQAHGQTLLEHSATAANTAGHITTIDHAATNDKPDAILIVSQVYGVYNNNEVGVWYSGGKWKVFNQNKQPMSANAKFNVLVLGSGQGKVHTTTAENTNKHITTLDGNYAANACLIVTQNYGKYNTSPVGVWYSGGKWKIYNEDRTPLPVGTKFNILSLPEQSAQKLGARINADVFQHKVIAANKSGYISYLDQVSTNSKPDQKVFVTPRYTSVYNPHVTGVWYVRNKWSVFNQDKQDLPENLVLNVFSLSPAALRTTDIRTTDLKATDVRVMNTKLAKQNTALKVDPGKWVIKPYTPPVKDAAPANPSAPPSTEIRGPNISLPPLPFTTIVPDPQYAPFLEGLHLFRDLYEDANKNANTFYYLPASYHLRWQKDNGQYSFFIYYLSATAAGERGDAIITAELNPGIDASNIALAEKLLGKKLGKPVKLLPMPLKDAPRVDFGSVLTNFGVKSESITINTPTDFLKPIVLSWKMDQRVDDLLGAMMSQVMISGNVEFSPYAEADKIISVPVQFKINDPGTFGMLEFDNAEAMFNGLQNRMDFPVVLNRVNVLRNNPNGLFTVESIPLGNYEVQPRSIFSSFHDSEKNRVLNGASIGKLWLDYALQDCPACNQTVQDKILGGTSTQRVKAINLEVLTPIAYARDSLNASYLKFRVKSKQGDPNGKSEIVFPFADIREDDKTLKVAELFVPEGSAIDMEYQAFLILGDGTAIEGPWVKASEDFITLGIRQVGEWFGASE